ncbi:MAG: permease-like cell division protein FtsX [Bulleidia sp.]|nr:permease-like cell division protein FtsX [Bulleidia sp.]
MISRPIKEGFRGVGRHWAMAISSSFAVTITLIIISLFMLFMVNVTRFTTNVEQGMEISVMIDYDYESSEDEAKLKQQITQLEGIKSVRYSSKDEELEYYISQFDDEETRSAVESLVDDNPMHDAYYVEVEDGKTLQDTAAAIRKMEGVSDVNYGGESTTNMVVAMNAVRRGGLIVVVAMTILAIFLIQNTIKLTIYARQDEITIERNVGATNGFIRSPFVIEGMVMGAMGAVIPIALTVVGYHYAYKITDGYLISNMFRLVTPKPLVIYISIVLLAIGMLVGLIGSYMSVTKYLKWKR